MQNNNFISKTIKTFVTSLVISVFVFGSFYFLLSDGSETSKPPSESSARKDSNTKLVMEEEPSNDTSKLNNSSIDIKKEVLGVNTNNAPVAQAQTGTMLAQISDTYDETVATTPAVQLTSPAVTTTTLTAPAVTYNGTSTATGVPTTGNEGLYILMAAFSIISGFLITNGKDLAMKNFEK